MSNLQIDNELIFCLETGKWSRLEEIVQKLSHPENKIEASDEIRKKNYEDVLVNGDVIGKVQASNANVYFIASSLIIIIVFYLVACSIAPLVNLNNQTFRVIFTLVGGIPSILFYSKIQTKDK